MINLPRVTYTNQGTDFSKLEDHFDIVLENFKSVLGKEYGHVINNKEIRNVWPDTSYKLYSPIDNTLIATFYDGKKDVDTAFEAAKNVKQSWSNLLPFERVDILLNVRDELEKNKYQLAAAALYEVGKNRMEAIGEAEEVIDFITYYCEEYLRNDGYNKEMVSANPNEEAKSVMLPFGIFGVISPFNFPLAMSINMIVGAILTGNTVVWKPTKGNALSSYLMMKSFIHGGLPAGVVNLVNGGDETGKAIVEHPDLDGLVFTGSNKVGMSIMKTMLENGKYARPCIVEMGGKNPSYVCSSADIEKAALGVARSAFGMSGQKCSANSKVYVHESVYEEFLEKLIETTKSLHILGDVRDRNFTLGPVINDASAKRFHDTIKRMLVDGGKVELGGNSLGLYCEPTIVTGLSMDHFSMTEEFFVPILVVQQFTDIETAIESGNDVLYGLTSGMYSKNEDEIEYFFDNAENGVKYVNRASGSTTGTWPGTTSFVGWKGTGSGSCKGGLGPNYLVQFLREQGRVRHY